MELPHSVEGPRGGGSRRADGLVPQPPGAVGGPAVRSAGVATGPWLGVGLGAVRMGGAGCEVPRFSARLALESSPSAAGCPRVPGTAPSGPRGSAAPYGVSRRSVSASGRGMAAWAGERAESDVSKKKKRTRADSPFPCPSDLSLSISLMVAPQRLLCALSYLAACVLPAAAGSGKTKRCLKLRKFTQSPLVLLLSHFVLT